MPRPFRPFDSPWLVPLAALAALGAIAFFSPADTRRALTNSAILAAGATAIALPLGTLLAVFVTRLDLAGRRLATLGLGLLLFLPLYVQLCGWVAAAGQIGWLTLHYGKVAQPLLAGMRGAIFVHGIAAVPWCALIVGLGLLQIDRAQEEAALLVLSPAAVLRRISLRQSVPFVIAAAIWTVVSTTSDMVVTNIFLMNASRERFERTYTEQFYSRYSRTADVGEATFAVLPGVLGLIVIVLVLLWIASQLSRRKQIAAAAGSLVFPAGPWRLSLSLVMCLTVGIMIAVPLASLFYRAGIEVLHQGEMRVRSWSLLKVGNEIALALKPSRYGLDFSWTLRVAAAAASLAALAGIALAWPARRGGRSGVLLLLAVVLGLAIPGPLVGVALIQLFDHDLPPHLSIGGSPKSWLLILYDQTPLLPILAQAIRALPLATLITWHSFRSLREDVLAAAALDGCSRWQVFWRIALPQRWRTILAAWLAAFAVAAGDLAWAHMVTPPGMDLIQRRVFGLIHAGTDEQYAAISLINIAAYSLLAGLVIWLLRPRGRTI